ncbi:MAG: hypothetical protein M0015_06800 [Betaproteobacteria bacterium]|nr:hypothetical protein [Betaproteobacteria bacterium]
MSKKTLKTSLAVAAAALAAAGALIARAAPPAAQAATPAVARPTAANGPNRHFGDAMHALDASAAELGTFADQAQKGAAKEARGLGHKLAAGGSWTRDEVAKGLHAVGNAIDALGREIHGAPKVTPSGGAA